MTILTHTGYHTELSGTAPVWRRHKNTFPFLGKFRSRSFWQHTWRKNSAVLGCAGKI